MTWPITDFGTAPPYQQVFDYTGSPDGTQPVYIGWASPGVATSEAKWAVRKLTYNATPAITNIQWANKAFAFNSIWDNRATLLYG